MDFHDTYAPVAKLSTIRLILAIAASKEWKLSQLDVNNAFLHGDLDETIYMDPPPGLTIEKGQVCLLHKSLYGLKKSADSGMQSFPLFSSLIILPKLLLIILSLLNLLIIASPFCLFTWMISIDHITSQLDKNFKIKNLGTLTYFLGFKIARNKHSINLSKRKYTFDILTETSMINCSPVSTPLNFSVKMQAASDPLDDPTTYRRLIGKLVYLTNTRPDIMYVVSHLSQYVVAPTKDHLQAAFRVIRYLKQTIGQGIFLPAHSDIHLRGYNDSDWANCVDTRRFVTNFIVILENHQLVANPKSKQPSPEAPQNQNIVLLLKHPVKFSG